jgi:hypothetical protein
VLFLDFNSFHAEVAFRIGIYGAYPGFCWRFRIVRVKRLLIQSASEIRSGPAGRNVKSWICMIVRYFFYVRI